MNEVVTVPLFHRYVAIGDSLTEGLGDDRFGWDRTHAGWADRLAAILYESNRCAGKTLTYANLAVRSRKLEHIMTDQLEHALNLAPDLVSVMAGGNNLWRSGIDWGQLKDTYRRGLGRLRDAGITVLVANSFNPVHVRAFAVARSRAARLTEMIETVAAEMDCHVIDLFRAPLLHDVRAWARDRVHFGGGAHSHIANMAADALGVPSRIQTPEHEMLAQARLSRFDWLTWVSRDVTPYFLRVARGVTAGDRVVAKRPQLSAVDDHPWSIRETASLPTVRPTLSHAQPKPDTPQLAFTA